MAARVSIAESAVRDLEGIRAWYAEQSTPEVGERLVREIVDCLGQIGEFAQSGRIVPGFDQPRLRELIHPLFRIVYRLEIDRFRVVRVWRSERSMEQ